MGTSSPFWCRVQCAIEHSGAPTPKEFPLDFLNQRVRIFVPHLQWRICDMRMKNINREQGNPAPQSENRSSGHTKPQAPLISLDQPGRLGVAHVLSLLGISHSTLYAGLKTFRYPPPDGRDGKMPYWKTETISRLLQS